MGAIARAFSDCLEEADTVDGPAIFFVIISEDAISDMTFYLVHWVLFREALRLEQNVVAFSKQVGNFTCAHTLCTLGHTKATITAFNVNNHHDWHSYRMRCCAAALSVVASKKK